MITEAQLTLQCVRWQSYIISPIMACSATASLKTNIKAITGNICRRQRCCSNRSDLCSNALLEMCTSSVMGHYTKCVSMNYYGFFRLNASSSRHICDDQVCAVSARDCCRTQIKRCTASVPMYSIVFGIRELYMWRVGRAIGIVRKAAPSPWFKFPHSSAQWELTATSETIWWRHL